MADPAELPYEHDPITDPEDSSDGESWCSSNGESCCSSDEGNPVKFEADNKVLLGLLKKVP